jgi:hypothetical protein
MMLTLTMGIAAIVLAITGWRDHAEARRLHAQVEAQVAEASARAQQAAAERASAARLTPPPYAADAWAAFQQQQFPLNAALTAIEAVTVVGVRVVSVDIVASEAAVRLQVEFSDYETLIRYLQELNAGEPAERWTLVTAQAGNGGVAGRPTANLLSTWRPEHNEVPGK